MPMAVEETFASRRMTHNNSFSVCGQDFEPPSHSKADVDFYYRLLRPPFLVPMGLSLWKQE